jgi:sugar O-acyltransferase (sialic acid O-acetyltransferase NeuD family)
MKRIGIFGTSGHAREVGDIAVELGYLPIYVARDQTERDVWIFPDDVMLESEVDRHSDIEFAIGIGENAIRQKVALRFAERLRFTPLIHPSATFGQRQRHAIEERQGAVVCAGVRFTNNIRVGHFTLFNLNATISHDVIVEDFVTVAPGACISGNVHLGYGCWVGAGAAINQGSNTRKLRVGANTVIGSGSVVVKDCEPDAVYVGIPARRIK